MTARIDKRAGRDIETGRLADVTIKSSDTRCLERTADDSKAVKHRERCRWRKPNSGNLERRRQSLPISLAPLELMDAPLPKRLRHILEERVGR
jgi:hypothetical protein